MKYNFTVVIWPYHCHQNTETQYTKEESMKKIE